MKVLALQKGKSWALENSGVFLFSLLMILASYIRVPIPYSPVPITLQTLVLYISLFALKNKAYFTQLLYLFLGVVGIPVFGGGAGLFYLFGPTGGYLLSFAVVAFIFPRFLPSTRELAKLAIFFSAATVVIYAMGMGWFMIMYRVSFAAAFGAGVMPFLFGDVLKIGIAVLMCRLR